LIKLITSALKFLRKTNIFVFDLKLKSAKHTNDMFKYIFILFLLIAFVPGLRSFLFEILVGRKIAKEQKRYNDIMEKQRGKEGEVKVKDNSNKKGKNTSFEGGEYVDFEEVK